MDSQSFYNAVREHIETDSATKGPYNVVSFLDSPLDETSFSCLVLVWEGDTDEEVEKCVYRFWVDSQNALHHAKLLKSEFPAGV